MKERIDQTITFFYDEDYYENITGLSGLKKGKRKKLYEAEVAILVKEDGSQIVIKSRYD